MTTFSISVWFNELYIDKFEAGLVFKMNLSNPTQANYNNLQFYIR